MAGYRDTLNLPKTDFPMKADLARREPERLALVEGARPLRAAARGARGRRCGCSTTARPTRTPTSTWAPRPTRSGRTRWSASPRCSASTRRTCPAGTTTACRSRSRSPSELREAGAHARPPGAAAALPRVRGRSGSGSSATSSSASASGASGSTPTSRWIPGFEAAILETFAALADEGLRAARPALDPLVPDRPHRARRGRDRVPGRPLAIDLRAFPAAATIRTDVLAGLRERSRAVAWTTTPWTLPANLRADGGSRRRRTSWSTRTATLATWSPRRGSARSPRPRAGRRIARRLAAAAKSCVGRRCSRARGATTPASSTARRYVSMEDGTGLVHTAPGHGKEDFAVGQRAGLGVVCPVDEAGRFTAGAEPFVGRSVLEVNDDIIALARASAAGCSPRGRLTHAYPHCWRCRQPVIFRATEQWFMIIDHDGHRDARARGDRARGALGAAGLARTASARRCARAPTGACRASAPGASAFPRSTARPAARPRCSIRRVMRRAADAHARARARTRGTSCRSSASCREGFACPQCGAAGPVPQGDRHPRRVVRLGLDPSRRARDAPGARRGLDARARGRRPGRLLRGSRPASRLVQLLADGGRRAHARARPYTDVLTHGWVLDARGPGDAQVARQRDLARRSSSRRTAPTSCAGGRSPPTGATTCASATRSSSAWPTPIGRCGTRSASCSATSSDFDPPPTRCRRSG